jgi:cell division protein FtsA
MELGKISPDNIIFALDIGTRSVIGTVGILRDKKFQILYESYVEHEERSMIDGQIHDISLVANAVISVKRNLESQLGFKLTEVAIAAAGRFLRTITANAEIEIQKDKEIDHEFIRGLEITAVKKAEKEINGHCDGKLYCVGYSVKSYYLNGYVITNLLSHMGEYAGVELIATFLPRSVVDSLYAVMKKVGLDVISLTLEPIAAIEAAIPQNLRLLNLALIDIGAGTSDIAISSKDSICAYGMVPMAGDEVTEAIAQTYLVDFNSAERIKKECSLKEKVSYLDILGIENEINSEEVLRVISPIVDKICDEISVKVIELNGGKAPNAVFLVGGGAHTPGLKEALAQRLNLPLQRIAIKDREAVTNCVCTDNALGSIGITVLGIALVSIKKSGHNFIDVILNGNRISLFNSSKRTVMDAMVQAGISPQVLIGKNGKNIRFSINGLKRIAFGSLAEGAHIRINEETAAIDSEIKEGDNIQITYARDGKEASPKVFEYIGNKDAISFYFNDVIYNLEPVAFINDKNSTLGETIRENDDVSIIYPRTIAEFTKFYLQSNNKDESVKYFLKDKEIFSDYNIKEGDRIYTKDLPVAINDRGEIKVEESREKNKISLIINDKPVVMHGKQKYIFIDIFDFIDFDLTKVKGNLVLMLNSKKAGYYDELSDGDLVKVYWE